MFDFQKLLVYQKAKEFNIEIYELIQHENFGRVVNDQLRRASFSIMLNIAERSSRFSQKDRKNFLVIARGSGFECLAILEYLRDIKVIDDKNYTSYFSQLETLSKMLFGLIRKL